jgi:HK97 family phage major capsid protein
LVKDRDPYDLTTIRTMGVPQETVARELSARAHDAIDQAPEYVPHDHREVAMRHVDHDPTGDIAKHYLQHGSPEYTDAFLRYMQTGEKRDAIRASLSTTAANGGVMIPFHLDPTIILTNAGTVNPFRQIASVDTISSNVWHGVSSAGVTAEWTAEAAEVTDASPTFTQPTITPVRADAYVAASRELVNSTDNLAAKIAGLFSDAKDRHEGTAFAVGTGSTQPWGIVTRLAATTASRVAVQTNAQFGAVDVFALVNQLPARYQDNCVWLAHWFVYNLARQFGGANQPNFWVDLGPGIPSQMLGRSTYLSSAMTNAAGGVTLSTATASTDNILVLGDFSAFQIVDMIGMEVLFDPLVKKYSAGRPSGEVSWTAFWNVGSDATNVDAFRLLQA